MFKDLLSEILVFKTNISCGDELERIASILSQEKSITRWTVDLEDVDKVLRIECGGMQPDAVVEILTEAGFLCEELT
jgi:hypothetical protein